MSPCLIYITQFKTKGVKENFLPCLGKFRNATCIGHTWLA